jgi:recombination protein RecT
VADETTRLNPLQQAQAGVVQIFKRNEKRFEAIAPKGLHGNRLATIALTSIMQNPDLIFCTKESLFAGVTESLKLGLALGGPMQECWLIPFKDHGTPKAQLIIGYMGLRSLVDRTGSVRDLHPRAVHNGKYQVREDGKMVWAETGRPDDFEAIFGSNPRITHRPHNPTPEHKEQLVGCYAVARLKGGGEQMEWLPLETIERHRNRSKTGSKPSSPWSTDYVQMGLKTALRVICKYLPKQSVPYGVQYALYVEDIQERSDNGALTLDPRDGIDIVDAEAKPIGELNAANRTDDLRARIEQQGAKVPAAAANTDHLKPATDVNDSDVRW